MPILRVNVHLLHALDLASLYETAELGDGLPFLLLRNGQLLCPYPSASCCAHLGLAATTATSTTAATATVTTTVSTRSKSAASGSRCVSHFVCRWIGLLLVYCQRLSRRRAGGRRRTAMFLRLVLLVAKLELRSSILQAAHLRVRAKRGEGALAFAVQVGPSEL